MKFCLALIICAAMISPAFADDHNQPTPTPTVAPTMSPPIVVNNSNNNSNSNTNVAQGGQGGKGGDANVNNNVNACSGFIACSPSANASANQNQTQHQGQNQSQSASANNSLNNNISTMLNNYNVSVPGLTSVSGYRLGDCSGGQVYGGVNTGNASGNPWVQSSQTALQLGLMVPLGPKPASCKPDTWASIAKCVALAQAGVSLDPAVFPDEARLCKGVKLAGK